MFSKIICCNCFFFSFLFSNKKKISSKHGDHHDQFEHALDKPRKKDIAIDFSFCSAIKRILAMTSVAKPGLIISGSLTTMSTFPKPPILF
jgi:hypothetical protein